MVKWAFGIVALVVAGAVATFGIWRMTDEPSQTLDNEKARAEVVAAQVASWCFDPEGPICETRELERVASGLWRMRMYDAEANSNICAAIDLDHFRVVDADTLHGVAQIDCSTM
jgi:hypothetical protein